MPTVSGAMPSVLFRPSLRESTSTLTHSVRLTRSARLTAAGTADGLVYSAMNIRPTKKNLRAFWGLKILSMTRDMKV